MPDSICTGSQVKINNTSTGGSSFYWNFCAAGISTAPVGENLGNLGGALAWPVFIDIVSDNGKYYGFVTNDNPSGLVRLDFGSSLLNTPSVTFLGTLGGAFPSVGGLEGIQVIKANGKWYAIMTGWNAATTGGVASRMLRVDFGTDITNANPVVADWGNIGSLAFPTDLYIFNEGSHWYGFVVNSTNNSITRFDFGSGFDNPPAATNIGNPGNLMSFPTGICTVKEGTNWYAFITSELGPMVRLNFGASLLNAPTAVNISTPATDAAMYEPRDLIILRACDATIGLVVTVGNDMVRLDFNNDLQSIPTATSLGNIGNFNFSHSLSKLFREGADLYCFIPNVNNGTLSRLKFSGCNNASIASSTLKDPPVVSYQQAGTYNVNLMMDDGLESASSFCKQIVVVGPDSFSLGNDSSVCMGDSVVLRYNGTSSGYVWQDGSSADTFTVRSTGRYILEELGLKGCTMSDTVNIRVLSNPTVRTLPDTAICRGTILTLKTDTTLADLVKWASAPGLSDPGLLSPGVSPVADARYIVTAYNGQCARSDTVMVLVNDTPAIAVKGDTLICKGGTAQLHVTGLGAYQYGWSPQLGLSAADIDAPQASPDSTTLYSLTATDVLGCRAHGDVTVKVKMPDAFRLTPDPARICIGDSLVLTVAANSDAISDTYTWLGDTGDQDLHSPVLIVSPGVSTVYEVQAEDNICHTGSRLSLQVSVLDKPMVTVTKSNDIDCIYGETELTVTGGKSYAWWPAETLTQPYSAETKARTDSNTWYYVKVTGDNGCSQVDSILVNATKAGGSIGFPVANAFTPNGDGNNDCFGIKFWGYIGEFEMSVFDRWGSRVYYSKDPYACWNGYFRGQPSPAGTYVYMIRVGAMCGTAMRKGTVTLIR